MRLQKSFEKKQSSSSKKIPLPQPAQPKKTKFQKTEQPNAHPTNFTEEESHQTQPPEEENHFVSKKSHLPQLQPPATKFQKTEQPHVHPTNAQQGETHQQQSDQEWNDILSIFGGATPLRHITDYVFQNHTIQEVETSNSFIDILVIQAVLGSVCDPLMMYHHRDSDWKELANAPFVTTFNSQNHFVAMKVDPTTIPPTATIRDSKVSCTNSNMVAKNAEIAAVRAKIRLLAKYEGDIFFFEELVQQQTENDCAIHTINNNLRWMLPPERQVIFKRQTLAKLLRTFL